MFLSEWREFPSAPCLTGKKLDDSSRLDVVEIARAPDMLPSLFFFPGRAKDISLPGNACYFCIKKTQINANQVIQC